MYIKTLIVAATAMLLAAAVAQPASAGMRMNGAELNGMRMNGVEQNGMKANGMRMNGRSWQGTGENVRAWQGTSSGATAFDIDGIELPMARQ